MVQLPTFKEARVQVAEEFVDRDMIKDAISVDWPRAVEYDELENETLQLHVELKAALS